MSQLFVDNIKNRTGGAVGFPTGVVVTGVATFNNQVSIAGTLSYEDVTNVDSTGIITAKSGVVVSGGEILVGSGFSVGQAGIVTASGGSFTGDVDISDKIIHTGDTDTAIRFPAADTFTVETGGSERVRVTGIGSVGIGQENPQSKLQIENAGEQLRLTYPSVASYIHEVKSNGDYAIDKDGTERLRIDSGGRILKGLTTARGNFGNNASGVNIESQIEGTSFTSSALSIIRNSNDANDGGIVLGKTRATSTGGSTVVQAGDDLGDITFAGSDGTSLLHGANIFAEVQSGVGNDDLPTDLIFKTNGGSTSTTERLRITSTGGVHFNNAELIERVSIVANKLSAVPNVSLDNGMVHYYTTNETTTATPNIISTAGINTSMATGDTMSVTIMSKPNNAGYFPKVSIDGVATGITTYWSGGSAPSSAESSGVDVNVYQIIKTANATYDVLANTSNFA